MHTIQSELANYKEFSDNDLIESVVAGWQVVCEENEEHRHMVLESEYADWMKFRDDKSATMEAVIESYEGTLSPSSRSFLENMASMICQAKHQTAAELLDDAPVLANTAKAPEEKKAGWLKSIRKLFGKKG